ncbi:MAG: hypothetical protein IH628_07370 [Proteobacteria bacterium]|nr:hypothetical protein [Pseudomonadota bacterium]
MRLCAFLVHWMQELPKTAFAKRLPTSAILFFVSTKNQKDALSHLAEAVPGSVMAGEKCDVPFRFPLFWAYSLAPLFLPSLLWSYLHANPYQRRAFRYVADIYLLTYGYYVVARSCVRRATPGCVVNANDHTMQNRVMTQVAQESKIPTVYVQHASVTDKFPPLSCDVALLEGLDALRKYEKRGSTRTRVYLIGMPKADAYVTALNRSATVRRVGICCNMLDDENHVEQLCRLLSTQLPDLQIVLRPHPSDRRRLPLWGEMARNSELSYSNPTTENALDFLTSIDALIAGESNIHLEAALLDVYPLYFAFSGKLFDWYGFLKNGVVEHFANADELCEKLKNLSTEKPPIRERCKPYCHTVGTQFDGQSTRLARELIEALATRQPVPNSMWQPLKPASMHAFEPR